METRVTRAEAVVAVGPRNDGAAVFVGLTGVSQYPRSTSSASRFRSVALSARALLFLCRAGGMGHSVSAISGSDAVIADATHDALARGVDIRARQAPAGTVTARAVANDDGTVFGTLAAVANLPLHALQQVLDEVEAQSTSTHTLVTFCPSYTCAAFLVFVTSEAWST